MRLIIGDWNRQRNVHIPFIVATTTGYLLNYICPKFQVENSWGGGGGLRWYGNQHFSNCSTVRFIFQECAPQNKLSWEIMHEIWIFFSFEGWEGDFILANPDNHLSVFWELAMLHGRKEGRIITSTLKRIKKYFFFK